MRLTSGTAVAWIVVAMAAWSGCHATEVERGVIRLAEPAAPLADEERPAEPDPLADARRGFDVDAFDGRLEGLWFQRKAYQREGRTGDADRQSTLIRDFIGEEGVRHLEAPAGALQLEAMAWLREGNSQKALAALSLADVLDPGRPQTSVSRARVYWTAGFGTMAATAELFRAARLILAAAVSDMAFFRESALDGVVALALAIVATSLLLVLRYQAVLRHDVEEWFLARGHETAAKAGGWGVLLLPLVLWVGAGWAVVYGLVVTFRYARRGEKALVLALLAGVALLVPAYRVAVGLYGLTADPTVRTTIDAAAGAYDPDRVVELRELVEAHPEEPTYRFLLAGLYKNGRYFEEAFAEYREVLERAPSTYQARINLGNIYFLLGQYGEAISHYRRAIDLRPDSVLAYYNMYLAQSDSFKLKEAADSLARARETDADEIGRLLSEGTREGGGPKVIDATIDLDAVWQTTMEGRAGGGLDPDTGVAPWTIAAGALWNPLGLVAALGLVACGAIAVSRSGRPAARRCERCGRAFCHACKSRRDAHDFCSQCVHLFVLRDGLAPETKSMKLFEIERHESRGRLGRRAASIVLPGAAHLLVGRPWSGATLVVRWIAAWTVGAPAAIGRLAGAAGAGSGLSALHAGSVPNLGGPEAAAILALPLAVAVWLAAHAGARRLRGA